MTVAGGLEGADPPDLAGLWGTWALIAAFYALARWYWQGQYLFAMEVI